jgi:hypothetical protein
MKPETMARLILGEAEHFFMGWRSGASFEGQAQVILDDLYRKHLSNHVTTGIDGTNFQIAGKSAVTSSAFRKPISSWPKMREITYSAPNPMSNNANVADLHVNNSRVRSDGAGGAELKTTNTWIELKVESPATNDFGGVGLLEAAINDLDKLATQRKYDNEFGLGGRRRYWSIIVAISPIQQAMLKDGLVPGVIAGTYPGTTATVSGSNTSGSLTVMVHEIDPDGGI